TYELRLGTILAMYIALASGWNLIGGMAGYPSFATAAFFGLGAYAGTLTQVKGGPMVFAWTFAAGVGGGRCVGCRWWCVGVCGGNRAAGDRHQLDGLDRRRHGREPADVAIKHAGASTSVLFRAGGPRRTCSRDMPVGRLLEARFRLGVHPPK